MQKNDCLFCKIVRREIPGAVVYEDARVLAFLDINPVNPGHVLVVPKGHYETLFDFPPEEAPHLIRALQTVGRAVMETTRAKGLNVIQNNFPEAGQTVFHMHWHLIPRHADDRLFPWPAGQYGSMEEMHDLAQEIVKNIRI